MNFFNYMNSIFKNSIKQIDDSNLNNKLSIYLKENYEFFQYNILGNDFVCMKSITNLQLKNYIKNYNLVKQNTGLDVIILYDYLSLKDRNFLIDNRIDFVVPNSQIFILRLGVLLNDRINQNKILNNEKFTPLTQQIFAYIFKNGYKGRVIKVKDIEEHLSLVKMSLKRGLDILEYHKIIDIHKAHGNSYISLPMKRLDMLDKATPLLINPVLRSYFIFSKDLKKEWEVNLYSSDCALARLTMLGFGEIDTFAISKIQDEKIMHKLKNDKYYDDMIEVQVYKYNPYILSENNCIDFISMYASLITSNDQRILSQLEALKENFDE